MRPLDDLLVLDLSRVLSGPYCSMLLGDFGARVIKIENPNGGDDTRAFGPPFVAGESVYFMSINRNKKSVAVDFKTPTGKAVIDKLVAKADVLLENFRPGALKKLGLDYEAVRKVNPRLIYCSISGFGHAGDPAWSRRPGYDLAIQGLGGLASITGEADGAPLKAGVSIADLVAGMYAFSGTLLALYARTRTGRGQHVDISMLDGQISLLTYHAGIHFATGRIPTRNGNRHPSIVPYETFKAKDGFFNLAIGNDSQWRAFCDAAKLPTLAAEAKYATNALRVENREQLIPALQKILGEKTVEDWIALCDAAGVPAGPIHDLAQALSHPQVLARQMVVPVEHPTAGSVRVTGVPVRLSDTPGAVDTAPPTLGQHTDEILRELGLTA